MNIEKHGTGSRLLRIVAAMLLLVSTTAAAGVLFKEEVNGDWRTCFYRDGTYVTTLTVHVSQPCPINN